MVSSFNLQGVFLQQLSENIIMRCHPSAAWWQKSEGNYICHRELDYFRLQSWITSTHNCATVNTTWVNVFIWNVLSLGKPHHREFILWLRVFCLNVDIAQAYHLNLAIKALHNWIQYQVSKQSKMNKFASGPCASTECTVEIQRNKQQKKQNFM